MALNPAESGADELPKSGGGVTGWTRPSLFLQVALISVLSVGAAVMVIQLASWRPLRFRGDLTLAGLNTLDPKLEQLLDRLPGEATIETFLRPELEIYRGVWLAATSRLHELLQEIELRYPDRISVVHHNLGDLAATQQRLTELGLTKEHSNFIVVRMGERREIYRLYGDVTEVRHASFEPGRANAPELLEFRGSKILAEGLTKVSLSGAPRIAFSVGHGEQDVFDNGASGLTQLREALELEGFEILTWGTDGEALPEDCDVVALVGGERPLSTSAVEDLRAFVDGGGRLLVALGAETPETTRTLLNEVGIDPLSGIVCLPVRNQLGQLYEGHPSCAELRLLGTALSVQHPVTRPLREYKRQVAASNAHGFARNRAGTPDRGFVLELLSPGKEAWLDEPGPGGKLNYAFDQMRERSFQSRAGGFAIGISAQFPPRSGAGAEPDASAPDEGAEVRQARVLALGTGNLLGNESFATNRDLALNAFNWLADRDYRISVAATDPNASRIDLERSRASLWIQVTALGGLPLLCVLLGSFLAWRRRR